MNDSHHVGRLRPMQVKDIFAFPRGCNRKVVALIVFNEGTILHDAHLLITKHQDKILTIAPFERHQIFFDVVVHGVAAIDRAGAIGHATIGLDDKVATGCKARLIASQVNATG